VRRALESATVQARDYEAINFEPHFERQDLPMARKPLLEWADEGCTDPDFLMCRRIRDGSRRRPNATADFHWCPLDQFKKRVIIPFRWRGINVGFTARDATGVSDRNT
jgi:hypothetical protein